MKKTFIFTVIVFIVGCSSNPVVKEKFGVTEINKQGVYKAFDYHWASIPAAENSALHMAANYCEKQGKETLIQSSRGWYSNLLTGRGSAIFVCLEYGSPDTNGFRLKNALYNKEKAQRTQAEIKARQQIINQNLLERSVKAQEQSADAINTISNKSSNKTTNCSTYGNTVNCTSY